MAGETTHKGTPTPDEITKANTGRYDQDTKTVKKVAGIGRFLLPLAGTAGVVATAVVLDRTVPGIHAAISSTYHDTLKLLRIEKDRVPPNFDNRLSDGVIGDNNILRGVSKQTIQKSPQFDEIGNPLFLMPTPKQGEVSHFEKKLVAPGILPDALEQAKAKNVQDKWRQEVEANTSIPMPFDGYVFSIVTDRGGGPAFGGVQVVFMTPNNTLDFVNITTDDNRRELLVDAPAVSKKNVFGGNYQEGLFLRRGESLFRPLVDTTVDYMRQSGENGSLASRRSPGDIIALTIPDPTTGEKKLPAPYK